MTATQTAPKPRTRSILLSRWEAAGMAAGRVTQLRRVVKLIEGVDYGGGMEFMRETDKGWVWRDRISETIEIPCPFGRAGDVLACKETWTMVRPWCDPETGYVEDVEEWAGPFPDSLPKGWRIWFAADSDDITSHPDDRLAKRYRPSATMPAHAVRFRPVIAAVRVEQCNSVTEADAKACGFPLPGMRPFTVNGKPATGMIFDPLMDFATTWNAIHGAGSWAANPWVWVLDITP